jgi:hypothetical protein
MTDTLEFPLINGLRHAFSSMKFVFVNTGEEIDIPDIKLFLKSIDYERTRDRGEVRANHPDPIAKTLGENSYSASMELYRAEFNLFLSTYGAGYGDAPFSLLVTWGLNGFETVTDTLQGCHFDSSGSGGSQGPDPSVVKIDLNPLKILFCGLDDLAVPLAPPA